MRASWGRLEGNVANAGETWRRGVDQQSHALWISKFQHCWNFQFLLRFSPLWSPVLGRSMVSPHSSSRLGGLKCYRECRSSLYALQIHVQIYISLFKKSESGLLDIYGPTSGHNIIPLFDGRSSSRAPQNCLVGQYLCFWIRQLSINQMDCFPSWVWSEELAMTWVGNMIRCLLEVFNNPHNAETENYDDNKTHYTPEGKGHCLVSRQIESRVPMFYSHALQ